MQEPLEITPSDQNYIYEQLSPLGGLFGEEVTCQCPIYSTDEAGDVELVPRILVIGKYRILLIKKEKGEKKVLKKNIHLYDLIEVSEPIINCNFNAMPNIIEIKYRDNSSTGGSGGGGGGGGAAAGGGGGAMTGGATSASQALHNQSQIKSFIIQSPSREIEIIIVKTLALTSWSISKGFPQEYIMRVNLNNPPNRYPQLKFDHDIGIADGKGIAECYIAHSHYFNTKSTLDYLRHLETLYQSRYPELDLSDIAGIDATSSLGFNLYTGIICLRHNRFIRSLKANSIPHINVTSAIGEMMLTNKTITQLEITNLLTEQSFTPIGNFLKNNPFTSLQILNLSNNTMNNESVVGLCDGLANFNHSLLSLNLSGCSIPTKGVALLFNSLQKNFGMSLTLEELILSDNRFQDAGSSAMSSWLNKTRGYNRLKRLILSNSQLNIGMIAPSLKVLSCIESLDLSKNSINIQSCRTLSMDGLEGIESREFKNLNLSSCGLVGESIATLLVALSRNSKLHNLTLNLQRNGFAQKTALILIQLLPQCAKSFLTGLDLSFNSFNARQLADIVQSLMGTCIESLDIGNNYLDSDLVLKVAELVKDNGLVKLGIGHQSKPLSSALHPLLLAVGSSKTMQVLDIVGNELNDHGACILADCLRHNKTLKRLYINGNKFTYVGWMSLSSPFIFYRNTTLLHLDLPTLSDPIQLSDSNSTILSPIKRDQMERDTFSKVRLQLILNKNKVPQSSRFAYLPNYDEPPTYVAPIATVPEHLLVYCTILPSAIDQMEKINLNSLNGNISNGNNSIRINLAIGGNGTVGHSSSTNTGSGGGGGNIRPSLSSIFSKPISLINDIRGGGGSSDTINSNNNSRVSTPLSWNENDNYNRNDDDKEELK
ncbi:leucine-rich repeat-containing protein [Dictyostelium discoideum AX4]|uniref:Leucine-rich repeat-containing protein n=1 Tax=Dictyostelium discoideum TaxID=44689 RepID=Q7KWW4_DICDI|nr:leucine-rich repeat-containing protein [Dictyostelium discoideum AX4]EAL68897.1 leucine-rich repeat-containing protein [Dictyostelium discoideum AX4]|eukprot:XP_642880.1 leucine-rich repeat-containing protein [Dictyostelium discoideum AX4]